MFKSNRVLRRIIYSHLFSGALLTALLLWVVSSVLTARIEQSTEQATQVLLRQTYQTTDALLNDAYGDFYTLWNKNPLIRAALGPSGVAPPQVTDVIRLLADTAVNNEIIHSVQLINRDTGLVISDKGGPVKFAESDDPGAILQLKDFALNFDAYRDEVFFPRTLELPTGNGAAPTGLLSFIFADRSSDGTIHSGLVVNIDRNRLAQLVSAAELPGNMLMVSPGGRLIADLTGTSAELALSSDDSAVLNTIAAVENQEGRLTQTFQGEKSFLVYQKADQLGFIFIRALPYRLLLTEARDTNRVVVTLFIVAILISLLGSAFSTWLIYHPLNRLVLRMREIIHPTAQAKPSSPEQALPDEFEYLQTAATALHDQNRQSGLIRLIYGQFDDRVLQSLRFAHNAFLPLTIMPDLAGGTDAGFINRLEQLANGFKGWQALVTAPDCVSVILNADAFDEASLVGIISQIRVLQQASCDQLNQSVSVGVGTVATGADAIRASHRAALAAAQQALSRGNGQIVIYSEIENLNPSASQNRSAITKAILDYITVNLGKPDLGPDEIAAHIGLSVGYMRQIFRLEQGVPINDYITDCRIAQARILLATTDLTAKKIAEAVGYLDSRYFYTLFKKKTGETTESYRQNQLTQRSDLGK